MRPSLFRQVERYVLSMKYLLLHISQNISERNRLLVSDAVRSHCLTIELAMRLLLGAKLQADTSAFARRRNARNSCSGSGLEK